MDSNSNCLSCIGANRNVSDCSCETGYYDDSGNDCVVYPERYSACHDDSNGITCKGNFRKDLSFQCECLAGYKEDPSSDNCIIDCVANCTACLLDGTCT